MAVFERQKFEFPKLQAPKSLKNKFIWLFVLAIFIAAVIGFSGGTISGGYFYSLIQEQLAKVNIKLPELPESKIIEKERVVEKEYVPQTSEEEKTIQAVKETSPAVVSIIITKDLPVIEQFFRSPFEEFFGIPQSRQRTEKQEVGGGSGFLISQDGLVLTNKHVVSDDEADYTVLTNDGKKYPAKVLARDPFQDLAVIKIEPEKGEKFPAVLLGDSDSVQIGQTVIAIGNALGEFQNTVSVGVVSGLGRTITASGGGLSEVLDNVIQTDAAINRGNSGGPLLNLKGEVIAVNTAMSEAAENIGFAIPINLAKEDIEQIKATGKIVKPFLGIEYTLITETIQKENDLDVDYGAWIKSVRTGTAAEKAGLRKDDIILEFGGEKITTDNPMSGLIKKHGVGEKVSMKVLRQGKERNMTIAIGEISG